MQKKENVSLSVAQISSWNQHIVIVVKWFIGFSLASSSDLFQKWKFIMFLFMFCSCGKKLSSDSALYADGSLVCVTRWHCCLIVKLTCRLS